MARFEFRLPDIGEGIAEAEIVAWPVKIGDRVEEDQGLADMMTDKATVEMESPVSGTVIALAGEVGDQVPIGSTLVVIETEGEASSEPEAAPVSAEVEEQIEAENPGVEEVVEQKPSPLQGRGLGEGETSQSTPAAEKPLSPTLSPEGERETRHVLASPAVRARAKDLGIDLSQVRHDGQHIRHADLDAYLRYSGGQGYHAPHASRAREDQPVKVIGMRRRIAENMAASKRQIPHFT